MDQPDYRVLLEGRMVGPYDRKTILGMRIKQMLSSDDILVRGDGTRLTVREMAREDQPGRGESKVQDALPAAEQPQPQSTATPMPRRRENPSPASSAQVLGIAMAGIGVVVTVVLLVLLLRRVY